MYTFEDDYAEENVFVVFRNLPVRIRDVISPHAQLIRVSQLTLKIAVLRSS